MNVTALFITYLQTTLCMRPYSRPREEFLHKWCENVRAIGLPEDDENKILALAILSFKKPLKEREYYLNQMLDLIHEMAVNYKINKG